MDADHLLLQSKYQAHWTCVGRRRHWHAWVAVGGNDRRVALSTKQTELRDESATVAETLANWKDLEPHDVRVALNVFEFAQNAAEIWRGSKMLEKREILESVSLNRMLGDVSLVIAKRKPFDELTKRPCVATSRDDWRIFEPWTNARNSYAQAFFSPRAWYLSELAYMSEEVA